MTHSNESSLDFQVTSLHQLADALRGQGWRAAVTVPADKQHPYVRVDHPQSPRTSGDVICIRSDLGTWNYRWSRGAAIMPAYDTPRVASAIVRLLSTAGTHYV